jgi:glycosyltransferase involved in cell wall biosynthesis
MEPGAKFGLQALCEPLQNDGQAPTDPAMSSQRISVVQLGARNHYLEALALHRRGLLAYLYTDFYFNSQSVLGSCVSRWGGLPEWLTPAIVKRSMGRVDASLPISMVRHFDAFGAFVAILDRLLPESMCLLRHILVGSTFSRIVAQSCDPNLSCIHAFNTEALELFRWAKPRGIRCILEQVSLPKEQEQALVAQEHQRWPGWERPRQLRFIGQYARRERQEWQLADLIIAPSEFIKAGLLREGVPEWRVRVVPFGIDTTRFAPGSVPRNAPDAGPLRVVFAGAVGLHKGVQ